MNVGLFHGIMGQMKSGKNPNPTAPNDKKSNNSRVTITTKRAPLNISKSLFSSIVANRAMLTEKVSNAHKTNTKPPNQNNDEYDFEPETDADSAYNEEPNVIDDTVLEDEYTDQQFAHRVNSTPQKHTNKDNASHVPSLTTSFRNLFEDFAQDDKIPLNSNDNSDNEEDTLIPVSQRFLTADAAPNMRGNPNTKKPPKQPPTMLRRSPRLATGLSNFGQQPTGVSSSTVEKSAIPGRKFNFKATTSKDQNSVSATSTKQPLPTKACTKGSDRNIDRNDPNNCSKKITNGVQVHQEKEYETD